MDRENLNSSVAAYLASLGVSDLPGWTIKIAQRNGLDVGFVLTNGSEMHIAPMDRGESLSRRNIHKFIVPMLEEFGYVTTRTPPDGIDYSWLTRVGFKQTWSDARFVYWALTELPYQRGKNHEI